MFKGIRALLGLHPKRSEVDEKIDEAIETPSLSTTISSSLITMTQKPLPSGSSNAAG
jgi:hypothetical protein